jgi:hypothetical protein
MSCSPSLALRALRALRPLAVAACGLSLLHCGGKDLTHDVTPNPDGGPPIVIPSCTGGGSLSLPGSRPTALACPATPNYSTAGPADVSCATLADCQDAGPAAYFQACRGGKCAIDPCLTDSECPSGDVCVCATEIGGGNAIHTNACVPAQCRVNADCGRSVGLCSPTRGYCGGVLGYYCHSAADSCITDADCCDASNPSCQYQPALGHFACQAAIGCNG